MYEEKLRETLKKIKKADKAAERECQIKWDSIAKPVDGLGQFEHIISKIAAMMGNTDVHIDKKAVVVMCADNGVIEEGVTQSDASVTAIVTQNLANGLTSVNAMADVAGAAVFPVDVGVAGRYCTDGVIVRKTAAGTKNITKGPAMSREEACETILTGIEIAGELIEKGYNIIATGEMGIGNTTTTTAICSVLTEMSAEELTGRGAGLDDKGLQRKISAVMRAVDINKPDKSDALDMLSKLGGFDIAGMTGLFLGGAVHRCPVIIDGAISAVSAVMAKLLCPDSVDYMIASHMGKEPAVAGLLEILELKPVIYADMALGEGTGAVMMMSLLNTAMNVYRRDVTFGDINMDAYERFDG